MKYTLIFSNKVPAKRLFDGYVLGCFNNYTDMSIKYYYIKNIRYALKNMGGPSYLYLNDKTLYKIKSITEL